MSYLKTACLSLITPFYLISFPLTADDAVLEEAVPPAAPMAAPEVKPGKPRVIGKFYCADSVQALPKLQALKNQDPDCNKLIIKFENFPISKEIFVDVKRLDSVDPTEYERKFSFFIGEDGKIQVTNSDHRLNHLLIGSRGYLPGETVYFRFRTEDGSIDKEISGIPTPAVVTNKEGKPVIRAELVSVNPTAYRIHLPQVENGEEYDLRATSLGETIKSRPTYNKSTGFLYAPAAKGIDLCR